MFYPFFSFTILGIWKEWEHCVSYNHAWWTLRIYGGNFTFWHDLDEQSSPTIIGCYKAYGVYQVNKFIYLFALVYIYWL